MLRRCLFGLEHEFNILEVERVDTTAVKVIMGVRAGRPARPGTGQQAGGDPLGGRAGRHRPPAARHHQNPYLKSRSWDDYAK
jgi:hypothetical protein